MPDSPTHRPPPPDQVPAWVAYSGVTIVGGTALIVLAYYQHLFGQHAHMPDLLSWTFSIGLDWGSAVGGIFWFFGAGPVRVWGRFAAIVLLVGSTILTCTAWGLESGWVWAPVGLIHPLVAFLMAKLLTVWRAHSAHARAETSALPEIMTEMRDRVDQLTDANAELVAGQAAALAAADERASAAEARAAAEAARADELLRSLHDVKEDLRVARRRQETAPAPPPRRASTPARNAVERAETSDWRPHLEQAAAYLRANPGAGRRMLRRPVEDGGAGLPVTDHATKSLHPQALALVAEQAAASAPEPTVQLVKDDAA